MPVERFCFQGSFGIRRVSLVTFRLPLTCGRGTYEMENKRGPYDKTKAIQENAIFDRVLDEADEYASLALFLPRMEEGTKEAAIKRLAEIRRTNDLVQQALNRHPDPLSFLANRASRSRWDCEFLRPEPEERKPEQDHGIGGGFLCITANGGELPIQNGELCHV